MYVLVTQNQKREWH